MRGKISKAMVALIAAAFVLCFVSSCDLDGPTQYIYRSDMAAGRVSNE